MRKRLAKLLLEKSYREGVFTLASGRKSDYYFDCRIAGLSCAGAWLIGEMFNELLAGDDIAGVGGLSMGADPLVTATSMLSKARRKGVLNALYIRKEPKDHGMGKQVEGIENFVSGAKIAVLDDVATTGGSILKARNALEKCGFQVVKACVILDREEGAAEALKEAGLVFQSVFTRKELLRLGQ